MHDPHCKSLIVLTSYPPIYQDCDCGYKPHDALCIQHRQEALDNAGGWDYGVPCICDIINSIRNEK